MNHFIRESFSEPVPEKESAYGSNVDILVELVRHTKKSSMDGVVTTEGYAAAEEYGASLKAKLPETDVVKVYYGALQKDIDRPVLNDPSISSNALERTASTAKAIAIGAETTYKNRGRENLTVAGKFSQDQYERIIEAINQHGDEGAGVQVMIDAGSERPDEASYSSDEFRREAASQLLHFVKLSAKLKNDSKAKVVLVSHAGVIEHFIRALFKAEVGGFVKAVGGSVQPLESISMRVYRTNKSEVALRFSFREHEIDITESELEKLATK